MELNKPRLKHILDTYDFDKESTERIQKLIDKASPDANYQKIKIDYQINYILVQNHIK